MFFQNLVSDTPYRVDCPVSPVRRAKGLHWNCAAMVVGGDVYIWMVLTSYGLRTRRSARLFQFAILGLKKSLSYKFWSYKFISIVFSCWNYICLSVFSESCRTVFVGVLVFSKVLEFVRYLSSYYLAFSSFLASVLRFPKNLTENKSCLPLFK